MVELRSISNRAGWRWNAWLTGLLALLVLVFGNRIAREHLRTKIDLSEDQLFAPSDVGVRLVRELADVLQVRAFFTGDVKSGAVQIAKRRLMDQLEEYVELSEGRIEVSYVDPNESSEARAEAEAIGLTPFTTPSLRGTAVVTQEIWLGLALRHRGREVVLPVVVPQYFEYAFLSGLRKLTREAEVTVGFLVERGAGGPDDFTELRSLVASQYRLREVLDLETGESVPEDVSVLVVVRPTELHPRTAFAIDQFVQRGGRALFLVDRTHVNLREGTTTAIRTGLEELLATWGAPVAESFVWDQGRSESIDVPVANGQSAEVPFPFWPRILPDGQDRSTPVTAQVPGMSFFWAQPIEAVEVDGVERIELAWTTTNSWLVPPTEGTHYDVRWLGARAAELINSGEGASRTVVASLSGRFPSPFTAGAPAPFDAVLETLHADRVRRAREEGRPEPAPPATNTDEEVLDAANPSQVVVIGDADWASVSEEMGNFLNAQNRYLFVNLVDWLALEDDLLALRSRLPTERRIADFVEEERAALGLVGGRGDGKLEVTPEVARLEAEADARADERRWSVMLRATGSALLATLLFWLLWRLVLARPPVSSGAAGSSGGTTRPGGGGAAA